MDLILHAIEGPDAGRDFRYEGHGTYVFGRAGDPDANLQCPTDARMSRRHAEVSFTPLGLRIKALSAGNPVLLEGAAVEEATLEAGQELVMGVTRLRLAVSARRDDPQRARLPRRRLGEFRIEGEIGRGAIGCVYEAVDLVTAQEVALKRFEPDLAFADADASIRGAANEKAVAYFRRELDLAARLKHPHIVRTLGVGREREELFLVLELVEGPTLTEHVEMVGPLSVAECLTLGESVLDALEHAHACGIIHRDVCPSNVMYDDGGDERVPKLADFGIGKSTSASASAELTRTGEARGKGNFMAPECLADAKRATPAADLFSVAATLYYGLTGQPWFGDAGSTWWERVARGGDVMVPLEGFAPGVPPELAALIRRALSRDPADRYASAAEMRAALVAIRDTLDARR